MTNNWGEVIIGMIGDLGATLVNHNEEKSDGSVASR